MTDVGIDLLDEDESSLAAERTELAWGRSMLSLIIVGTAVATGFPQLAGIVPHPVAGLSIIATGTVAWVVSLPYARARVRASRSGQAHVATPRDLLPVTIGTVLVGCSALVICLFLPK